MNPSTLNFYEKRNRVHRNCVDMHAAAVASSRPGIPPERNAPKGGFSVWGPSQRLPPQASPRSRQPPLGIREGTSQKREGVAIRSHMDALRVYVCGTLRAQLSVLPGRAEYGMAPLLQVAVTPDAKETEMDLPKGSGWAFPLEDEQYLSCPPFLRPVTPRP